MAENTVNQSSLESLSALVDNQATELELHRLLKQSESCAEAGSDSTGGNPVRDTWARYQVASAAMRGDLPQAPYVDLSASISAAIADEPVHGVAATASDVDQVNTANANTHTEAESAPRSWWQAASRFAVAASVCGVVILGAKQYQLQHSDVTADVALVPTASQSVPLPAGYTAPSFNTRTVGSHDRYQPNPGLNEARKVIILPRTTEGTDYKGQPVELDANAKRKIQAHLNQLMLEHAEHAALNSGRGMLPFARVARMEEE